MSGTISNAKSGRKTIISIKGPLNFEMHSQFQATYQAEPEKEIKGRRFVIDLSEAMYIDSSALGMLMQLRNKVGENAADIEIINARPEIRKTFSTANFQKFFKIT